MTERILAPEILHASEFNRPVFQMGPHDNAALALNFEIIRRAERIPEIEWSRYIGKGHSYTLTASGSEAIEMAVEDLGLAATDEILILTTSASPYVSHCVTDAITRYCRWSRRPSTHTKALFVIHEFGFPAAIPPELIQAGYPIIEDCAYAFGSQNDEDTVGRIGDYVVYSFSKAFPIAFGGLLKGPRQPARRSALTAQASGELPVLLAHHLGNLEAACRQRRRVFEQYRLRFAAEGLFPLFEPGPAVVPHSFVVALANQERAEAMKPKLNKAGIISSVFYGGGGYFLPNHQSLSEAAVEYVFAHFMAAFREV